RLQLLKGRLGPFQLFQTLAYPIDPDRLLATLELAEAAQHANADTANIQHVVLGAEVFAGDGEESSPFPPPRPDPRVAPARELPAPAARSVPPARRPPRASSAPASARFRTSPATAVAAAPELPPPEEVAPPRRNPVRFPPRIQQPSDAVPPVGSSSEDVLAQASELAREELTPLAIEPHSRKRAIVVIAAALALGLLVGGLKFFGARPASAPAGTVAAVQPSPVAPVAQSGSESAPASGISQTASTGTASAAAAGSASVVTAPAVAAPLPAASETPRPTHHRPPALAATSSSGGTNSPSVLGASSPALPPETPVGLTMAPRETLPVGNTAAAHSDPLAPAASSGSGEGRGASEPVSATAAAPGPRATAATHPNKPATTSSNTPAPSNSDEPPPVVREAKLIHAVKADYPSAARRDGIEGYVELAVTVSAQGAVTNVTVSRANPPGVFEKAAVTAVRHYRYDPRYVDGLPAEAHLQVHLDFNPASDAR